MRVLLLMAAGLLLATSGLSRAEDECQPPGGEYKTVDLARYQLTVTPSNTCLRVAVVGTLGIIPNKETPENGSTASVAVIDLPRYHSTVPVHLILELDQITGAQREFLADNCKLDLRCAARWKITLLRHFAGEGSAMPAEFVRLDGWSN